MEYMGWAAVVFVVFIAAVLTATAGMLLAITAIRGGSLGRASRSGLAFAGREVVRLDRRSELDRVIDEAVKLNEFRVSVHGGFTPHVSIRYTPRSHDAATAEIARNYLKGHAVSIEFSHLDDLSAVRLVDFCSGLAAGSYGWIFRVTDTAMILTPLSASRALGEGE